MGFINKLVKCFFHIDINAIREENELLKSSLSEEQQMSKKKDSRLSQLETDAKSLRREVANLKSRRTLLEGEISTLKFKLGDAHEESTSDAQENNPSIIQLDIWKVRLDEKTKEVEELKDELYAAHKEYEALAKKLSVIQRKYDSVKSELENLQQRHPAELTELQSECQRLSNRLAVVNSDRERLLEQLNILHNNTRHELRTKREQQIKECDLGITSSIEHSNSISGKKNLATGPTITICDILESILRYKNKQIPDIITCSKDNANDNATCKYNVADILNSLIQHSNNTLTGILSVLSGSECVVITDNAVHEQPITTESYSITSSKGEYEHPNDAESNIIDTKYDRKEILPNNSILYSDGEDWYLLGINDALAIYNDSDEIQINLLSEKYKIYNLTIKKHIYIGQKPIEFYFFRDQIFKFDKSSKVWTLWYTKEENLLSSTNEIKVTNDNQLKLIKDDAVVYISPDGTISEEAYIDEPEYLEQIPLKNGYFIVKLIDGYWGIVDDENNYAVLAQYDMISPINGKYLRFQTGDKWGVMNIEGDILIDAKYHSIESYSNGEFVVTKKNTLKPGEIITEKIAL